MQVMRTLVVVVACGCNHLPVTSGPAAAASEVPRKVFAVPDELMEFRASLRGVTLGTVQTAVGRPGWVGDRQAIIVRSRGHSEGLAALLGDIRWELQTTIDLDAGAVLDDREEAWVDVAGDHEHHEQSYTGQHDPHSFAGVLRGWHSTAGQHATARVGVGGAHLPVELWHAGTELVGDKPAVRYDGKAHEVPFQLWISDDAARVPLAFRAESPLGTLAIELVDYHVTVD